MADDLPDALRMTARLQSATTSGRPVLLSYDGAQGHGMHRAVTPVAQQARQDARELAFFASELGLS